MCIPWCRAFGNRGAAHGRAAGRYFGSNRRTPIAATVADWHEPGIDPHQGKLGAYQTRCVIAEQGALGCKFHLRRRCAKPGAMDPAVCTPCRVLSQTRPASAFTRLGSTPSLPAAPRISCHVAASTGTPSALRLARQARSGSPATSTASKPSVAARP